MGPGEKIKAQVLGGQIEKRGVGLRQRKVLLAEYLTRWEKKQGREVTGGGGADMKWLQKGKNIVLNYILKKKIPGLFRRQMWVHDP